MSWKERLIEGLTRGMKLDFQYDMNRFCLLFAAGQYRVANPTYPRCHPLETVLLGIESPLAGEPINDISQVVGESEDWVRGFCDEVKGSGSKESSLDYVNGVMAARDPEIRKLL